MNTQYRTIETEIITDEDWCSHCENAVGAWIVVFEKDSEGEYEKVRRCPHCREKCFQDGISQFLFWPATILGFAAIGLWILPFWLAGIELDIEWVFVPILVGGMIQSMVLYAVAAKIWKNQLYRKREKRHERRGLKVVTDESNDKIDEVAEA